jgi:hypothetical protein
VSGAKTAATILSPVNALMQADASRQVSKSIANIPKPTVTEPTSMPIFGSPNQLNALRSSIQEQLVRRGRAASILTSEAGGERLGS